MHEVAAAEQLMDEPQEASGAKATLDKEPATADSPAPAAYPAPHAPPVAADRPAAECAPAAESSAEGSRPASPAAAAEEPPATPAHMLPASPALRGPNATPTGLGLSSLPPLSPLSVGVLPAATPAATPVSGVTAGHAGVSHALQAAVQVGWAVAVRLNRSGTCLCLRACIPTCCLLLPGTKAFACCPCNVAQALGGNVGSPAAAPSPVAPATSAAAASPDPELPFRGFGSPLRQEAESPGGMAVSIGGAVGAASASRRGSTPKFGGASASEDADVTSISLAGGWLGGPHAALTGVRVKQPCSLTLCK